MKYVWIITGEYVGPNYKQTFDNVIGACKTEKAAITYCSSQSRGNWMYSWVKVKVF